MLKPSGEFFKKMFNPGRMAEAKRPMTARSRSMKATPFGRTIGKSNSTAAPKRAGIFSRTKEY